MSSAAHQDDKHILSLSKVDALRMGAGAAVSCVASAVKELVDNAIDAKATYIEVLLEDCGLSAIQVTDNGCGIAPSDFGNLCRPNATSKVRTVDELCGVKTLGFRGQALHALVNVSAGVTVTTRHKTEPLATTLDFEPSGELASRTSRPRNVGTCVRVTRLFERLPVRRTSLRRDSRRQLSAALSAVQQLALAATHIKITCIHVDQHSKRSRLAATSGKNNLRGTIADLYGPICLKTLVPVETASGSDAPLVDDDSRAIFGLNEAQCSMANDFSISGLVSSCAHDCGRRTADRQFISLNSRPVDMPQLCKVANELYKQFNRYQLPALFLDVRMGHDGVDVNVSSDKRRVLMAQEPVLAALLQSLLRACWTRAAGVCRPLGDAAAQPPAKVARQSEIDLFTTPPTRRNSKCLLLARPSHSFNDRSSDRRRGIVQQERVTPTLRMLHHRVVDKLILVPIPDARLGLPPGLPPVLLEHVIAQKSTAVDTASLDELRRRRPSHVLARPASLEHVAAARAAATTAAAARERTRGGGFTAAIDAANNEAAENELVTHLNKADFGTMRVVGQFNRGFVVTQLGTDLFVVDQHASDEKRRFEELVRNEQLHCQQLITPVRLELGAAAVNALRHNEEALRRNGFRVTFSQGDADHDGVCSAHLVAVPQLHGELLGPDDVAELAHVLMESPGALYRPKRVRAIFAMKACRSAIMIGQHLEMGKMQQVVERLATLENPWWDAIQTKT